MSIKYTFFYKSKLSQWHMVNFVVDGITFNCAEQYMMYKKSMLFGDETSAKRILNATHPRDHQIIGRHVKGFDQELWDQSKYHIVYTGNYHKFTQNKEDWEFLDATGDTILVEASPVDTVWGVGLSATDPRIQDEKNWRGQNLLGKALTEVRNNIRKGVK